MLDRKRALTNDNNHNKNKLLASHQNKDFESFMETSERRASKTSQVYLMKEFSYSIHQILQNYNMSADTTSQYL